MKRYGNISIGKELSNRNISIFQLSEINAWVPMAYVANDDSFDL